MRKSALDLPHVRARHARARRSRGRRRRRPLRARLPFQRSPRGRAGRPPRRASARSREGMRTAACLEVLRETRERVGTDIPLIPMTYASLLEAYGWERFRDDAHEAGATSLIVADLPVDERPELSVSSSSRRPPPTSGSASRPSRRTAGSTSSRSRGRPGRGPTSPPRSPGSSSAPARSRTSRSTPASASRRPSTLAPRPTSRTASSSARGRSNSPPKAPSLCATSSQAFGRQSTGKVGSRRGARRVFCTSRFLEEASAGRPTRSRFRRHGRPAAPRLAGAMAAGPDRTRRARS